MRDYLNWVDSQRDQPLSASTKSKHVIVIRKVLKTAYEAGVIDSIAPMPKVARPSLTAEDMQTYPVRIENGEILVGLPR